MDSEVFSQAEVAAAIDQHYVPVKINTQDMPAIAKQYAIRNLPADLVLAPDGRVLERREGAKNAAHYMGEMGQIAQEQKRMLAGAPALAKSQPVPAAAPLAPSPNLAVSAPAAAPWAQQRPQQRGRGVALRRLRSAVGLVVAGRVADLDQPKPGVLGDGLFVLGVELLESALQDHPDLLDLLDRT